MQLCGGEGMMTILYSVMHGGWGVYDDYTLQSDAWGVGGNVLQLNG